MTLSIQQLSSDPESIGLSCLPILKKFDTIGELSYKNASMTWVACNTCKQNTVDLYNASDPNTGKQYIPDALKELPSS